MTSKKNNDKLIISITVLFLITSFLGYSANNAPIIALETVPENENSFINSAITVDGNLTQSEWADAEHKIDWFMDADPENSDGYNYLYLAEDYNNLYVALDLCSDQTNNTADEWVGIWLNTDETVTSGSYDELLDGWYNGLNNGLESLIYDVENNRVMPMFDPSGDLYYQNNYVDNLNDFSVVHGTLSGEAADLDSYDGNVLDITSEFNGTHYIYRWDLNLTLADFYEHFIDLFVNHTQEVELRMRFLFNTTVGEHFISVADENGNIIQDQIETLYTGTSNTYDIYFNDKDNFTTEQYTTLSFNGVHTAPFNVSFDYMRLYMNHNDTNPIATGSLDYPWSTIDDFDVSWDFGPSENNETYHRMFEFRIPKTQLENYTSNSDLGVIVGGYGTLAAWPNTHYWVYSNGTDSGDPGTGISETSTENYYYYSMPLKLVPDTPVLDEVSPNPTNELSVSLEWNDDLEVDNWTVYRHSEEITESNLNVAIEIATEISDADYTDTVSELGTYWYAVVANNAYGRSGVSNSIDVVIVDTVAPVITGPSDIAFGYGETGHTIDWNCSDIHPTSFSLERNGTTIVNGDWNGSDISHEIGELTSGTYNFTLILEDEGGNIATDTVIVTIEPEDTTTTTSEITTETTTSPSTNTPDNPMILIAGIGAGAVVIILIVVYSLRKK